MGLTTEQKKAAKDAAKAAGKAPGGLAALTASLKNKLENTDAPVAEVETEQQAEETKPEEPKASNGKSKQADIPTEIPVAKVENANLEIEQPQTNDETIEVDFAVLMGRLEALEVISGQLGTALKQTSDLLSAANQKIETQANEIAELKADRQRHEAMVVSTMNKNVDLICRGAFQRHGKAFANHWEDKIGEVLETVNGVRTEVATATVKVTRMARHESTLEHLTEIADVPEQVAAMVDQKLAEVDTKLVEIRTARNDIAKMLGAEIEQTAEEAELDPFAS